MQLRRARFLSYEWSMCQGARPHNVDLAVTIAFRIECNPSTVGCPGRIGIAVLRLKPFTLYGGIRQSFLADPLRLIV